MNHQARKGSISLLAGAYCCRWPASATQLQASVGGRRKQPSRPLAKELQQARTYTVSSAPAAPLELAEPKLPDTSGYTAEADRRENRAQQRPARSACAG